MSADDGSVRHAGAHLRDGHGRRPQDGRQGCSTTAATGATSTSGRSRAHALPRLTTCTPTAACSPDGAARRPRCIDQLTTSTRATRCRRSAATSRRARASCCRAPGTSAAASTSGTGPQPLPLSARNDVLVFQTEPLERRPGGHRRDRGQALGLVVGRRHRLHRQADRRLPAERRLSRRLRPEPRRRHHPGPLPRVARQQER